MHRGWGNFVVSINIQTMLSLEPEYWIRSYTRRKRFIDSYYWCLGCVVAKRRYASVVCGSMCLKSRAPKQSSHASKRRDSLWSRQTSWYAPTAAACLSPTLTGPHASMMIDVCSVVSSAVAGKFLWTSTQKLVEDSTTADLWSYVRTLKKPCYLCDQSQCVACDRSTPHQRPTMA